MQISDPTAEVKASNEATRRLQYGHVPQIPLRVLFMGVPYDFGGPKKMDSKFRELPMKTPPMM